MALETLRSAGRGRIAGDEAKALIETQLATHSRGILSTLSRYRLPDAVASLHETIRAIEEFINIPLFGMKNEQATAQLLSLPIGTAFASNPGPIFQAAHQLLEPHFEAGVVRRYLRTLLQICAIGESFRLNAQGQFAAGPDLRSVGAAVTYFQSRRRHFVTLLYTMPVLCRGRDKLTVLDALNVLLPQIEYSGIAITSFYQKRALLDLLDDFTLEVDTDGAMASYRFEALDGCFLEPERASIMAMFELRRDSIDPPHLEKLDPRKVFSAAELRNTAKLIRAAYAVFDLDESVFSAVTQLVTVFSRYCRDDYFIELPKSKFQAMVRAQAQLEPAELERLLVNMPSDYAINSNAYEPFIDLGDVVITNVNLLSRFLYFFKNRHFGSRRRFQVHAGFIFEDMVKRDLAAMGFTVTDVKRINRQEFDVVVTHRGVIYNFQCKNNWIDLAKVESDRKLFVRYNRTLVNYYRRALAKEAKRECLLKETLSLDRVEHYVISRFPVICTDQRVINYNQIGERLSVLVGGAS